MLLVAGFTTILTAQVPSYVPTDGLVGYWPFNGNANDVSTNANNGTNNGATLTNDRFGNVNSAYSFDNTNISLPISSTSLINNYTLSLWVKLNNASISWPTFIQGINSANSDRYLMLQYSLSLNKFNFYTPVGNSTAGVSVLAANTSSVGTWYNIIITNNNKVCRMYINGIFSYSANPVYINVVGNKLIVGDGGKNIELFNGLVDDIGIWNRALTPDEITNLYKANICYQNVTVTDTLVINLGTLSYNPVTYNNSITIYPNPTKDRITIDCGTLSAVTGYQIKISNLLGQEVFSTTLNQQQYSIPLNSWTGKGIYLVTVYDANRNLLTTRKIDLQ
ncbi:LamG-like jellyroll fold domain-containing protein [Flavobacterium myungsuense]